jgi:hypothetical protein
LTHMCSIVPFMAGDALSTITESTAFDSEEDESEAAFNKQENKIWDKAMRKTLAGVKSKAGSAAKAASGTALGKDKRKARAPKQQGRAKGSSFSSAAPSLNWDI